MSTTLTDGTVFTNPARFADEEGWHAEVGELRRNNPIVRVAVEGFPEFWAITRYADVMEIEGHPEVFHNTMNSDLVSLEHTRIAQESGLQAETLVHMDDPKHKQYRLLTADWFRPSALRKTMAEKVTALAREYVDHMAAFGGECDFASDIAKFYPLRVIMGILGVPTEDEPLMLTLTQRIMGPEDPDYQITGNEAADFAASVNEVFGYFFALAQARRKDPTADLATVIAKGTIDGQPLGDMETLSYYLILAAAGHDTTSATIAAGVEALARNPEQFQKLKDNPALLPNAVEEMVRWAAPVKQFTRTAMSDYQLGDTLISAGDRVLLSFPSACRDESTFEDPFRFDITRKNAGRHLGFGSGPHFCLGAPLARMEIAAFFTELLARVDSLEVTGPVERTHGSTVSGIKRLPLRYVMSS